MATAYHHLPRDSSEDNKSDDRLMESSLPFSEGFSRGATNRRSLLSQLLHNVPTFLSLLLCILLALDIAAWHRGSPSDHITTAMSTYTRWDGCPIPDHCPKCPTLDSRKVYRTNFFNDYRYQSLDHQYDYVFEEMMYDGGVFMPNEEHGGNNESAVIGM